MTSVPTIGRIVHYRLNETDANRINARRDEDPTTGNRVEAGQDYPAIVVRTWSTSVNLKVFLDGKDTYWATSKQWATAQQDGDGQGCWHWPARS